MTDPSGAPRTEPARLRAVRPAAIALVALALAGAIAVDAVGPEPRVAAPLVSPPATGGVWACPVVATGRAGGWLNLANVSTQPSTVRVRWVRPPLKPATAPLALRPSSVVSLRTPASTSDAGVSAIVEWAGGEVVASRGMLTPISTKRSVALGGSCSRPGARVLVAPGASTLGGDTQIVVLNPSAADALVAVSFLVDGDEVTPQTTRARVVPARGRLVVRAGDFVFDRGLFAAVVRVTTGTVAADAEVRTPSAGFLVPAAAPVTGGAAATHQLSGARLEVVALGDDPTTLEAATITARTRGATAGVPPALDPFDPVAVPFTGAGPLAVSAIDRVGAHFAGVLLWGMRGGDASAVPLAETSSRWIGVMGPPAPSAKSVRLVLANPGDAAATIHVRAFASAGERSPEALASITVPAGRASSYSLAFLRGSSFALEVQASVPVSAALVATVADKGLAYAYSVAGEPARAFEPVPLRIEPRAGVDAP